MRQRAFVGSGYWRSFGLVLWVLLAAGWVRMAPGLPVVEVHAGFDGFHRPGDWFPVVVTVNNQPTDSRGGATLEAFRGVLSIPATSQSDPPRSYVFSREIEVPAFSNQRFYLYAKGAEKSPPTFVELRTPGGRLLATYPLSLNPLTPGGVLLLSVTRDLAPVRLPPLTGFDPIVRANSPPERLPEHFWGYEGVSLVVLSGWSETYLRPAQEEALESWLRAGGTLVVVAGSDPGAWRGGFMDRLLPGGVEESVRLQADPLTGAVRMAADSGGSVESGQFVAARLKPGLGAEVLAEADGLPLVVRARHGRGSLIFFALDFRSPPEAVVRALSPLWRDLVPYEPLTASKPSFRSEVRAAIPVVSRRAARPPNIIVILVLLVGYAVAVGPVNFRLLSKRKKVEWAWVTVPLIVLFFSVLIYGIGAMTKGGRLIVREAALLIGTAGERTATLDGLIAIFSPTKSSYAATPTDSALAVGVAEEWSQLAVEFRRGFATFQPIQLGAQSTGLFGLGTSPGVVQLLDNKQVVSSLPLGQWDVGFLETFGTVDLGGAVEADLVFHGDRLTGTLHNGTARALRSPVLVHAGLAYPLPRDLLPGDRFELDGEEIVGGALGDATRSRTWINAKSALEAVLIGHPALDTEERKIVAHTKNYLAYNHLFPPMTSRLFPPHGGEAWLLAFGEDPEAPLAFDFKPTVSTHAVCHAIRLPLRPAPGPLHVRPNQTRVEMLSYSREGDLFFNDEHRLEMRDSACILSASLPFDRTDVALDSITLSLVGQEGSGQDVSVQLFDLRTSRWEELPMLRESDLVEFRERVVGDVSRFATPLNGRVFLRIVSRQSEHRPQTFRRTHSSISIIEVEYHATVR